MADDSAVVLMPARNEESRIGETVRAALSIEGVLHVVVADDASNDHTSRAATEAGAHVVRLHRHGGKGEALTRALSLAKRLPGGLPPIVLLLDADLAGTASQASALLAEVAAGRADMAIAGFPPAESGAGFGKVKGLAAQAIRSVDPTLEFTSPLSGQRAIRAECLELLMPFAKGYGVEVALTVRALRQGMRVVEIPLTMTHATTGNDIRGIAHRARQYLDVRRTVRELHRRLP